MGHVSDGGVRKYLVDFGFGLGDVFWWMVVTDRQRVRELDTGVDLARYQNIFCDDSVYLGPRNFSSFSV